MEKYAVVRTAMEKTAAEKAKADAERTKKTKKPEVSNKRNTKPS